MNVYQKVANAINYGNGSIVKIVLNQAEHLAMSRYTGQHLADRLVKSVSTDGTFSIIELG